MPVDPEEALWFIRQLKHTKGKWARQPFTIYPWQERFIRKTLRIKPDGHRQVQRSLLGVARKNGKSELGAALALTLLVCDREPGGEVVGAAGGKRPQAAIILETAKRMVRYSKIGGRPLSDFLQVRRDSIYFEETDSVYYTVATDAEKEHGLNPSAIVFDEYHVLGEKRDLLDALDTAQGAREDPLLLFLTTAGPMPLGVCWDEYQHAQEVASGYRNDPEFHCDWYEADRELPLHSEEAMRQANPGYGTIVKPEYLQRKVQRVYEGRDPEYTVRRLHFNQWTTALERWLPFKRWRACDKRAEIPDGSEVCLGVDAALKRDSFGVTIVRREEGAGTTETETGLFIPAGVAHVHAKAFVPEHEGEYIDQTDVRTYILGLAARLRVKKLYYDPAYMTLFAQQLADAGLDVEPYPQSDANMLSASETLQRLVLDDRLRYGGPGARVLNEQMAAVGTKTSDRGVRISKGKSGARIDVVVAMVMPMQAMFGEEQEPQDYAEVI